MRSSLLVLLLGFVLVMRYVLAAVTGAVLVTFVPIVRVIVVLVMAAGGAATAELHE